MSEVTIIIPSYNHARFLKDRLYSIEQQTFTDWEIIIIDDFSSDDSYKILESFVNKNSDKIKFFIKNAINSGSGYSSWEKGIHLANTKYIWIAETDDFSAPTFLENQIQILNTTNAVLSFCSTTYVDFKGKYLYDSTERTKALNVNKYDYRIIKGEFLLKTMPFKTYITNGSAVVFKKPESEIPTDIFNNELCSDLFLWTYLLKDNSFAFINKNLNFFRRHEGSISSYLQKNKLENVYHEKAKYLNHFEQTEKYGHFIDHYIKHYIWNNKKDFLNTSSIEKIKTDKRLKMLYFYRLLRFFIFKIFKK